VKDKVPNCIIDEFVRMSSITNFRSKRGKVGEVASEEFFLSNDERIYLHPELELELEGPTNNNNDKVGSSYNCSIS
jgi:hypothetical protein